MLDIFASILCPLLLPQTSKNSKILIRGKLIRDQQSATSGSHRKGHVIFPLSVSVLSSTERTILPASELTHRAFLGGFFLLTMIPGLQRAEETRIVTHG